MKSNLEEYNNPSLYDFENDRYTEDISYLIKWAKKTGGVLIDLACGTGRATIPLAKQGYRLVGVDIHEGMLEKAKQKSDNLPIHWVTQNCMHLQLDITSKFIYMVGNSFQHFLTNEDQNQLLRSVHYHLEKDGVFIFNTRFPSREELLQPAEEEYWRNYTDPSTGLNVDVFTISEYNSLTQIQHYTTIRRAQDGSEKRTDIQLRYVYPQELERLARENGFKVLQLFGDWKETPLSSKSLEMICILQKEL
ncbi:class I SAM-dependent methyltransferase [Ornithinibacillus halotolerans]|uniref:Methyltransferase n=1 Tax=Ornithinibacillus halotolerans TaxID=1274357 RepID=A0A916RTA3_9BACI|nr:class I SAM-dependent methyltransferase [Ornithinibacillus halotolerans]GGA70115.1 methyltransferase [Ornithinibacillus halotolerans]